MNKIFKKVWNRKRRCFVAVSEVMTAAGQSAGKAAGIVITAAFVGYIAPSEALVVNGDHRVSDMPGVSHNIQHNQDASVTVNGNFYDDSTVGFYIAEKNKDGGYQTAELIVNGSAYIQFPKIVEHPNQPTAFTIVHVHYSDSNGTFSIRDDLHVDNISHINTSNFYSDTKGTATSSLIVGGTAYIYGNINSPSTSNHDGQYAISDHSINNLDLFGNYFGVWTNNTQYKRTIQNAVLRTGSSFIQGDTSGLANSYDTVNFGNLTIENGAVLSNSNFLTIGENSQNGISVGQTLTLKGGTVSNRTVLTQVGGSVNVNSGFYDFGTLNKTNGTLSNISSLSITNFNQSGGTTTNNGTLSIGNSNLYGSLNNTGTLNLTGNVTTRGNLTSTGTLTNNGNWTETNRFTIAGNLNNTGSVNFQNGFQFGNGRLTSSGTIQTNNALDVFDSLGTTGRQGLHYVALNSTVPQEVKTSLTDFFLKYVPGTVAKTLADHASFTGGKVIVTGVNLTTTQRDDLLQAFKAKFFPLGAQQETALPSAFLNLKTLG